MIPRNGNNAGMLAILAAMGAGMGDGFGLPAMRAPRTDGPRPKPADPEDEVRKLDGADMRHRITGERRMVNVCGDHCVFVNGRGKCLSRSFRKAMDWIRNADVVAGGAP